MNVRFVEARNHGPAGRGVDCGVRAHHRHRDLIAADVDNPFVPHGNRRGNRTAGIQRDDAAPRQHKIRLFSRFKRKHSNTPHKRNRQKTYNEIGTGTPVTRIHVILSEDSPRSNISVPSSATPADLPSLADRSLAQIPLA